MSNFKQTLSDNHLRRLHTARSEVSVALKNLGNLHGIQAVQTALSLCTEPKTILDHCKLMEDDNFRQLSDDHLKILHKESHEIIEALKTISGLEGLQAIQPLLEIYEKDHNVAKRLIIKQYKKACGGWTAVTSRSTGETYYYNEVTKVSQRDKPKQLKGRPGMC